jgi:hypothetical protein
MSATVFSPPAAPPALAAIDELYAKMAIAAAVFMVVFEIGYFAVSKPPFDALGYLIGRDFVNMWMGARAVLTGDPSPYFNFEAYNIALRGVFGPAYPEHNWVYPPPLLLFTWPLGLLSYLPAYVVWTALGFALYLWVAAGSERRADRLFLLAVAPAVVINIFTGQNGFFTAALLIGALSQLDRRPLVAGLLFGLLTLKPQMGLLMPLMLLLTGRWRVIATAVATTAVLAMLTTLAFGTHIWVIWLRDAVPFQNHVMSYGGGIFPPMMPTAFMNARIAGWSLSVAWTLQGLLSAIAVAMVSWTFWRRRDPVLSTALLVTAAFLATPYAFNYDMVVFGWVLALLRERGGDLLDHRLGFAVWTLPIVTMLLGLAHIPGSCLVLLAFAARLLWRMKQDETAEASRDLPFHTTPAEMMRGPLSARH